MSKPRLNLYLTEQQATDYTQAASSELREPNDWARNILDLVSSSEITVVELKEILEGLHILINGARQSLYESAAKKERLEVSEWAVRHLDEVAERVLGVPND